MHHTVCSIEFDMSTGPCRRCEQVSQSCYSDDRGDQSQWRRADTFLFSETIRCRTACTRHSLSLLLNINAPPRAALSYLEQSWRRSLSAKCLARRRSEISSGGWGREGREVGAQGWGDWRGGHCTCSTRQSARTPPNLPESRLSCAEMLQRMSKKKPPGGGLRSHPRKQLSVCCRMPTQNPIEEK